MLSYDVKIGPTTGMLAVSLRDRERIATQALPSLIAGIKASKKVPQKGTGHLSRGKCLNSWMHDCNCWRLLEQVGML